MSVLKDFPMVSQLTKITSDGHPSENAQFDCVAASIGACVLWHENKSQWDDTVNPDMLKDAAYSEGYTGGTSAIAYVTTLAKMGYKLAPTNGIPGQLVGDIHLLLARGIPVVLTEPDPYVPSSYGWSHVCVAFADTASTITVLDPYIGKPVTRSDTDWLNNLLFNQIWTVEPLTKEEIPLIIDLNSASVSPYFELATPDGNAWRCRATGKVVQGGILEFYRTYGPGLCGLTNLGLPLSNEIPVESLPNLGTTYHSLQGKDVVVQYYERGVVAYDPEKLVDNPPGAGSVYLVHVDKLPGQDPRVVLLENQQAQSGSVTVIQKELDAALARIKTAQAALAILN